MQQDRQRLAFDLWPLILLNRYAHVPSLNERGSHLEHCHSGCYALGYLDVQPICVARTWPTEFIHYVPKVRRFYDTKMNLPGATTIEFFTGPHTIHGEGTFEFLRKHLRWPAQGQ